MKADSKRDEQSLLDWEDLIGFDGLPEKFTALVRKKCFPPGVLLEGRQGLGKRRFAAQVAATLLCESRSACGTCPSCKSIIHHRHPELLWIEAETIKLADAAAIQEHLDFMASGEAGARIVVIVDAERMNPQAANRLLKTLEEPPPSAHIILTTSCKGALLPTVLSRLVAVHIRPPEFSVSLAWLREQLPEENEEVLSQRLAAAGMAPGAALGVETGLFGDEISGRTFVDIMDRAEALSKNKGTGPREWLGFIEWNLNRRYKAALASGRTDATWLSPARIHARRQALRKFKELAVDGNVTLNNRLFFETVGIIEA